MTKPVIFYGTTQKCATKIDKYIKIAKSEPVVFSTKDDEVENYKGKLFLDKYEVISIDEAKSKYPDAEVWVTYSNADNTAKVLSKIYDPSQIHFFDADLEYRLGCNYIGHFIDYGGSYISPCCIVGYNPTIDVQGTVSERVGAWKKYCEKLIDDLRNKRPNDCSNCPHLHYGFYRKNVKLDTVSFGSTHAGDVCNLKCIYCFADEALNKLKHDTTKSTNHEVVRQLAEMPEYKDEKIFIQFANGEFCANKYCNQTLDILLKNKWIATFMTNMTIYNEKFAEYLNTGRVTFVQVSLDSGTRKTYAKVKGADLFDKVVNNLKKYPLDKTFLDLKYIFLEGYNDNEEDIDGFCKLAIESNCKQISLSANLAKPYTNKMRELTKRLIKKAKSHGIYVTESNAYLTKEDKKFIRDTYRNTSLDLPIEELYNAKIEGHGNAIIHNTTGTGKIEGNGALILNEGIIPSSNAECALILADNSTLIINKELSAKPKTTIELFEKAKMEVGSLKIGYGAVIRCKNSLIVGDNVEISDNCHIEDAIIGNNVKIECGAIIQAGVKIGDGTTIKAGAVVDKNVPKNAIAKGNPAKIKKAPFWLIKRN